MEYTFLDFLTLIGSVGLFLYGMKVMSEGLQKVAGDRLRNILAVMTKNRFSGMLTGILITALLLTWIALLTADILHRWTKSKLTLPLALFPVAALFFLHYNVNYQYTGTIAFLWMLLFLRLRVQQSADDLIGD